MKHLLTTEVQELLLTELDEQGISQKELARRLGIAETQMSRMLHDPDRNLTLKSVERMAFALGIRLEVKKREDER